MCVNIVPAGREVGEHLVTPPRHRQDLLHRLRPPPVARSARICGEQLKRCTLELGGKSAAIILDDADLAAAIPGCMPNALMNNGQACVAQTRILAPRRPLRRGRRRAGRPRCRRCKVGDPLDPETAVGPLVASRQRDRVEGYIAKGRDEGARVVVGGGRPAGLDKGWYVEPTLFADVDNTMTIAQEEIFGPVLVGHPLRRRRRRGAHRQRLRLRPVGLGVDRRRRRPASTSPAGCAPAPTASTASAWTSPSPFGGFKQSGVGRELGPEGLDEYLEHKAINLPAGWTPPPSNELASDHAYTLA